MQRWAAVPFLHAIQRLRSELLVGHTMRRAELQAEQCGRGAGQQQRKAHQTTTAVEPKTSGWKRMPSAQSSNRMPQRMVHPAPRMPTARMSPPSPTALKPRMRSQKPRTTGSVAEERATLKTRMRPRTISMTPQASIHPRPVT